MLYLIIPGQNPTPTHLPHGVLTGLECQARLHVDKVEVGPTRPSRTLGEAQLKRRNPTYVRGLGICFYHYYYFLLQLLEKLNTIRLSCCQHLIEIPDISVSAPNLEKLTLDGC